MRTHFNGFEMAYEDSGQGQALLLVHGFPLQGSMWQRQVPELQKHFRVIVPDLRGFGASLPAVRSYSMDAYADDLATLLSHLSLEKAIYVGFSMGGYIGMAFCRRHASRLVGLVMADSRAGADSPEGKQGRYNTIKIVEEKGVRPYAQSFAPRLFGPQTVQNRPALVEEAKALIAGQSVDAIVAAAAAMAERPDTLQVIRDLPVALLALVGAEDALTPPAESRLMAEAAKQGSLVVIPSAGHLSNWEQPERWNQAVIGWTQQLSANC